MGNRNERHHSFGIRVSSLGTRVSGLGTRVSSLGTRISSLGTRISGSGTRISRSGTHATGLAVRMGGSGIRVSSAVLILLMALSLPSSSLAQGPAADASGPPPEWSARTEIGASVFFGASDQTTITTKLGLSRETSRAELVSDLSYLYGESTNDDGATFVNKRSWAVGSTLNYREFSRVNPYAFVNALSSLEKKIELRYKGGAGAKFTALDSEASRLDFAVAVLAEKTLEKSEENGNEELLARWTGELLFRRSFGEDRTLLEATVEYNPVFDEFANYTVEAEAGLSFRLSEIVSLKLSVEDNYDSRAKTRGARDNNDGRVLFSVLASF